MTGQSAWARRRHLDRALRDAARLHRTGEVARAEAGYGRILAQDVDHPGALHGMGLLALQAGRADVAIAHIGRAARLAPDHAPYHLDLGLALRGQGHFEEARAAFHVAALLDPQDPAPLSAMAGVLLPLGRLAEAEECCRRAIALAQNQAALHHLLAMILKSDGRLADAARALTAAAESDPGNVAVRNDLAGLLLEMRAPEAAEREVRAALALAPGHPAALNNLGLALQDQDRPAEALAAFEAACRAAPADLGARNNLGVALRDLDRTDEALACFDRVLARDPGHASAHLNAASILLMRGDFKRGWAEFEWRDRVPGAAAAPVEGPRWEGEALDGRTLLVHAEMGFGDTIQFCRFVSRIEGRVALLAPAPLRRLLGTLPGYVHIVTDEALASAPTGAGTIAAAGAAPHPVPPRNGDGADASPSPLRAGTGRAFAAHIGSGPIPKAIPRPRGEGAPFDLICPLLSLPRLLGAGPGVGKYLHADPAPFHDRVEALPGRRVGVCWSGSREYALDRRRSLPDAMLAKLSLPGVSLVSLQKGSPVPNGVAMVDWTGELRDFADTAALIAAIDVVVSVDTAIAHLAGALGKPVLLLDRFAGDWRWMRGRADSPWYPTMTIFRQPAPGDWDSVLREVAAALS